jgi:ribose transport system ATP-binding protein
MADGCTDDRSGTHDASRGAEAARDASDLLLELTNISKRFPGVVALEGVDFDVRRGEVHVLFGENGAGKSTLTNVIAGTYPADTGTFKYQGKEIAHLTPQGARVIGISPVFQEFSLVPELTVEQNLFLGRELTAGGFLNRRAMHARARAVVQELNFDLRPDYKVAQLSRAHQQMVEIAKAFLTEVRLLILDEPTASLTDAEAAKLFDLVTRLKASGVGIIYVSHRMHEIKQIADRITVLRDGHKIKTVAAGDVSETELVELMTGRKIGVLFPKIEHMPGNKLLEVERVTLVDQSVNDVSFYARAGEITGIAGLVGCGKSEVVRAIVGLEPIESGVVRVHGAEVTAPKPATMTKLGVCYFPSDRVAEGLALARPVRENVSMAALDLPDFSRHRILQRRSERRIVQGIVEKLSLRPPLIERAVASFSGGNRQKILLARGLTRDISVYLFDEPTVGVDVGAKIEIYALMKALVANGVAIVLVSSDLPEVLNLSHRLYVMHRSRMAAELTGADINEPAVLAHFFRERQGKGAANVAADAAVTNDAAARGHH